MTYAKDTTQNLLFILKTILKFSYGVGEHFMTLSNINENNTQDNFLMNWLFF